MIRIAGQGFLLSSACWRLLAALTGGLVVLRLTIDFGHRPSTGDPAGLLHAVQSRVERALTTVAPMKLVAAD